MTKITAYGALASPQPDDVLPVVDVHDTSMASSGTTKKITVDSLRAVPVKTVTGVNTTAATDCLTLCNAAGGGFTNTLPDATAVLSGAPYIFEKTDATANEVKLLPVSAQTVDGATYFVLAAAGASVTLRSDGSNWQAF